MNNEIDDDDNIDNDNDNNVILLLIPHPVTMGHRSFLWLPHRAI